MEETTASKGIRMEEEVKEDVSVTKMAEHYRPSHNNGIFGSYRNLINYHPFKISKSPKMPNPYLPSANNGICGKYIWSEYQYKYSPAISNGCFGQYLFNEKTKKELTPIISYKNKTVIKKNNKKNQNKTHPSYKPSINHPRRPKTKNESNLNEDNEKFGVKIMAEWKIPVKSNNNQNNDNDDQKNNGFGTFYICEGSVVYFTGEAIVNAANEGMLGGGGVDGAISDAGGNILYEYRKKYPVLPNSRWARCQTGDSKITLSGYPKNRLKCDFVIHSVGPSYGYSSSTKKNDMLLYNAYKTSMELGKEYNLKQIGFCLISSGIFRGNQSLENVINIGIKSIMDNMYNGCEIYLIGFNRSEIYTLNESAPSVLGKPNKQYSKPDRYSSKGSGFGSFFGNFRFSGNKNKKFKRKG